MHMSWQRTYPDVMASDESGEVNVELVFLNPGERSITVNSREYPEEGALTSIRLLPILTGSLNSGLALSLR